MRYVLKNQEMQTVDHETIHGIGIPGLVLMERASKAVADKAAQIADHSQRILIISGIGNNGGDALACTLVLYIGVGQFAPAAMSLEGTAWQAWSPEAVQAARNSGKPVFIDFTAAWCVTCQVNKKAVIDTEDVESAARSLGYARFLADWTNKDPAISAELARYRHNGVPLYIVISKSGAVKVLPELLTKDTLLSALKEGAN